MSKKKVMEELLKRPSTASNKPEVQKTVKEYIQKPVNTAQKKKATFLMDAELHKQLKAYSATEGKKMIEVVEEAVKMYLQKNSYM